MSAVRPSLLRRMFLATRSHDARLELWKAFVTETRTVVSLYTFSPAEMLSASKWLATRGPVLTSAVFALAHGYAQFDSQFATWMHSSAHAAYARWASWRFAAHHKALLSGVHGRVLDLGAGSNAGSTLPFLPDLEMDYVACGVTEDGGVQERFKQRAFEAGVPPGVMVLESVSSLELLRRQERSSADAVISSFALGRLASPNQVREALDEVHRVLRPGGKLYFLERLPAVRAASSSWLTRAQQAVCDLFFLPRPTPIDPRSIAEDARFSRMELAFLGGALGASPEELSVTELQKEFISSIDELEDEYDWDELDEARTYDEIYLDAVENEPFAPSHEKKEPEPEPEPVERFRLLGKRSLVMPLLAGVLTKLSDADIDDTQDENNRSELDVFRFGRFSKLKPQMRLE